MRYHFGLLVFLVLSLSHGYWTQKSYRWNDLPGEIDPYLVAYPSPAEDGTFFLVNISDSGDNDLGRNSPEEVDYGIKFFLYTKKEGSDDEETNEIRIGEENPSWLKFFNRNATLRIFCHGYKSSHEKPFPAEMKTGLLGNSVNVNLVMIAWDTLANSDMVQTAIRNMRIVGQKTFEMLNYVYRFGGLDFKNVHFIGHNLGAHIGGIVGELVQRFANLKLGRITALDPAVVKDCDDQLNLLDLTDAQLVTAIHTETGNYCGVLWKSTLGGVVRQWGSAGQVGHIDYYPTMLENNGRRSHCNSYKILKDFMLKNVKTFDTTVFCKCNESPDSNCKCRGGYWNL